ncbi:cysteine-rich VLP protein [Anaerotruncus rubiinfantis]|uniref:cysteine-rich VLP protein n=1 Tax=Anaerotruncus rubiinfantis TaxID=1720200 RepID=UPI0011C868C1|nr:cysteine-rich VLP protein [Anaerotruncus rubiinfantis]
MKAHITGIYISPEPRLTLPQMGSSSSKLFTGRQAQQVHSMVKRQCANYIAEWNECGVTGDLCAQLQSNHLCCNYFRRAVLPVDPVLETEIIGTPAEKDLIKKCSVCGEKFRVTSNRQKFCKDCAETQRLRRNAARQARYREKVTL